MIEREWIVEKLEGYRAAYMEHLAMANANHGAMQAMEEALAEFDGGSRAIERRGTSSPTEDRGTEAPAELAQPDNNL